MNSADYAMARCLSVCLVTRRYYVETAKGIIKVFAPSGSQTILVIFPYQTVWQYSDGNPPLNGASNARGV